MDEHPADDQSAIGVDVGGTFTDVAAWTGGELVTGKVSSTRDQSEGVLAGAATVGSTRLAHFLHGTTVATNALLERRGARTALVTSAGFEDVLEIGRQDRPSLYDSFADRPETLVPRPLRFGWSDAAAAEIAAEFGSALGDVEAVAVSLLYGYREEGAERVIAAALAAARPELAVSLSSQVSPEFREFERTSTTVLNAYLAPITSGYLRRLAALAENAGLPKQISVMRSSGGLIPIARAVELPAAILLSGPAGGVVAASAVGAAAGRSSVISFDMGGTSTDVCRIDNGRPEVAYERPIEGYPCRLPSAAIHTVGAGGGSIGWIDAGGSLRVGPRSAGAEPGPAAYGRGGIEATVTDANIVLARIDPGGRLAGRLALDPGAARRALAALGDELRLDPMTVAGGVVTVVEETMAGAIRKVSVEQGADPRRSTLVAFGGAGGLHAISLARGLEMDGVLIPPYAGVFSALGLLLSPPRADEARTMLGLEPSLVAAELEGVASRAADRLAAMGEVVVRIDTFVDVRYLGQAHELPVPHRAGDGPDRLRAEFDRLHHERNGFSRPEDPIEIVTVRAEAIGRSRLVWDDLPSWQPHGEARVGTRMVRTHEREDVEAGVWRRAGLAPGMEIAGPAVIEETEATTYLGPGDSALIHESGAIEVRW